MKHSQPTPTANRFSSSGSGRWMLATPQPVTFPGGNHSCPAECTAWWDLKFCTRSCCSRPGSWWESWSSATETLGFPKIPCWGHVHLRFWGSCDMALWASMSHSFVYVSIFFGFRKKDWRVSHGEFNTPSDLPRPSRMLPRHCKDCISIMTFRSIQPTPKSPEFRTSVFFK